MKKLLSIAAIITGITAGSLTLPSLDGVSQSLEASAQCTSVQPGPDWICVNGGWLPPGMTPPASQSAPRQAPPSSTVACTTGRPGPDWVCFNGGWLPPGMTPPASQSAPPAPQPQAPPSSGPCTSGRPAPDWVCVNGGWLPPGMVPAAQPAPPTWEPPAWEPPAWEPPSNSVSGDAPAWQAPPAAGQGGRVRVMTWNIHFGHGDPAGQARVIADSGADVVLLQEAQTWDEHMPTTYAARLQALTGQAWQSFWSENDNSNCAGGCQGVLVLSRLPIVDRSTATLSGTTASRATIDVGGVRVNVFNIHLEYYDTGKRSAQLQQFMDWTRQFGGIRLAGGDFNSWWDEWWIRQMETEYSDTWQDVTGSDMDGYTLNNAVRFDYLFRSHDEGWRLTPGAAWVQWTGLSDHGALIADYTVR